MDAARSRFNQIVEEAERDLHGTKTFVDLNGLFNEEFKMKPGRAMAFLGATNLARRPVRSADIRLEAPEALMAAGLPGDYDPGDFPFLQGDIIKSKSVVPLTGTALPHTSFWQVVSRDCDSARAAWVRVSPVVFVSKGDPDWQRYLVGLVFRSPNLSSLPPIACVNDDKGLLTDLKHPYFLERSDCNLSTQIPSLTETGWHLFCATLAATINQVKDMNESLALRRL